MIANNYESDYKNIKHVLVVHYVRDDTVQAAFTADTITYDTGHLKLCFGHH